MTLLERDAQLNRLADLLAQSRRGHGSVVLVAGEAGIGKTAVVEAFRNTHAGDAQVLWGSCDAVVPARPFAPLTDMAAGQPELRRALDSGDRNEVFDAALGILRQPSRTPKIIVLEDLHWADDATLDLLRVVGRRLATTPALVVGTYRDDEVGPRHPLRLALGDLPAGVTAELKVPPLSVAAVGQLTGRDHAEALSLHRATAGNPFFVTEIMSASGEALPSTVRDAVLARVARLSYPAQSVLHAASVLGQRCELDLLIAVADSPTEALDECIARGMLHLDGGFVEFRHELARRAALDAVPPRQRTVIHARALAYLRAAGDVTDPGRLVHHAEGSGDAAAVLELAPAAGAWASRLGAHREAAAHYRLALRFAEGLDDRSRAVLLERHAAQASLAADVSAAMESQLDAIECWRRAGDRLREGDCLRFVSLLEWMQGDSERALALAATAVDLLESVEPPGRELARAYAVLAQRQATAGVDDTMTRVWAQRALELAERLDYEPVAIHALTTIGFVDAYLDHPSGWASLEESARRARAAGLDELVVRALVNLIEAGRDLRRYEVADRYGGETIAYCEDRGLEVYRRRAVGALAEVALERGQWREAEAQVEELLGVTRTAGVIRASALTLLGRLRAMRGDAGAWEALDEARLLLGDVSEGQFICPLRAARAEAAWLSGNELLAREEATRGMAAAPDTFDPWSRGELAYWWWKSGGTPLQVTDVAAPYLLQWTGRAAEAADSWAILGCPYRQALALAETSDEDRIRTALAIFISLGARPMAARVSQRLRAMGVRHVPRGPRQPARQNAAGLTAREQEILGMVALGMHNSDIAERLVLSPKTVDHHVSAILRKLGASDRTAAVSEAERLGLQFGETTAPR